jgi:hypothetical protein
MSLKCRVPTPAAAALSHVTASTPPSYSSSPLRPYTAHTAPPWPHSRERRICDAPTSVCARAGPNCLPIAIRRGPYTQPCIRFTPQITCTDSSQSCPMQSRPRTSRTATCQVCDCMPVCMRLQYADASPRHNGQHAAHGCRMYHLLRLRCTADMTSRYSPGTSTASLSKLVCSTDMARLE